MSLIVSISGIRGIVGESLTPDTVGQFAAAFAAWLKPGASVVVARDTRPSGETFAAHAVGVLVDSGCQVLDLGVCATPTAKLMVLELQADGAIIVTASHNPSEWNGLKLIRSDGIFLNADQSRQVEELYHRRDSRPGSGGKSEAVDLIMVHSRHLQRLLNSIDADAIRRAGLRAAVDYCNGAGSLLIPDLLESLNVEHVPLNASPDGCFAHNPEPVPANLVQLCEVVEANSASVGFAVDPDADRVALVDESGHPVGEDYTLALAVQARALRQSGIVVTTLSTSQAVSDVAVAHGCPVVLTPVGEVHVVEAMVEQMAIVGGEGNGGVILTEIDPGRDAAVGIALTLEALAQNRTTVSDLVSRLPTYSIEKRKVSCTAEQLGAAVAELQHRYAQAYLHPVRDGAKLYLSGRLECPWIHLRASNTEPVARVLAESESPSEAKALCDEAEEIIAGAG